MKVNFKKIFINPYTISLVLMVLIVIGLLIGTMSWLDTYTNHGNEIVVPDLTELRRDEASQILNESGLKCEVVDSIYVKGAKLGAVVEQIPEAGSTVKSGRTIYLIINSNTIRKVSIPDIRDVSLRQAEAVITSVGLIVDSVEYVPSEYKDLVQDIKSDGRLLAAGERIPEGSKVVLLVGRGAADEEIEVVSLRGLNPDQAINKAHTAYLNVGKEIYDNQQKPDEQARSKYFVYKQEPITSSKVRVGTPVNIYLTTDPNKLEIPEEIFVDSTAIDAGEEGLFQ